MRCETYKLQSDGSYEHTVKEISEPIGDLLYDTVKNLAEQNLGMIVCGAQLTDHVKETQSEIQTLLIPSTT